MDKLLSFILLILLTTHSIGQNKQDKQLIKNIDQLVAEKYKTIAPGGVVLVAKNNQIIYDKSFGTASLELNTPMRSEMIFRIGSITKQFTAIAVLQLVEQGKISLQDSLQKFIPDFPYKGHAITIENLLTHTSGIVDYGVLNFHIRNAIRVDFPAKQLIDSFARLPLNFTPSTQYGYSNSNYLLLGYIIERVSGKSYKDYLQKNVFDPVGLSSTYYDDPSKIITNRASGYAKNSSGFRNADYISMAQVFSAGAMLSNVDDLFKWHTALHSYKLVRQETLERAFTPFRLSDGKISEYGYGWFIKDGGGHKSIGHGGAIDGFRSMGTYFPGQDIYVVALFNSEDDAFFNLFENITGLVIGNSLTNAHKDFKIDNQILDRYVGTYLNEQYPADSIKIYKEGDKLYCDLANNSGRHMPLVAQSQTLFYLPVIKRIPTTVEFIIENGEVKGIYWTQEKKVEAKKVR